jgi:hypothetical protein
MVRLPHEAQTPTDPFETECGAGHVTARALSYSQGNATHTGILSGFATPSLSAGLVRFQCTSIARSRRVLFETSPLQPCPHLKAFALCWVNVGRRKALSPGTVLFTTEEVS